MYHIISDVNTSVDLQQYIDNRNGNKKIGLRNITYTLGWYNIEHETIKIDKERPYEIASGYYSFQQLVDIFQSQGVTLNANEVNGIVTLTSPNDIKISKGLKSMLGLHHKIFIANKTYSGNKPLDLAVHKNIYIHLEQLNTSQNYYNGAPSTILTMIPIENKQFGDIVSVNFEHPQYKLLTNGAITELKLDVRDENNKTIDNHGLPINCVLEIL